MKDVQRFLGIFNRSQGLILQNQPLFLQPVPKQPFPHLLCLRNILVFFCCPAAGADDPGVRVLRRTIKADLKTFNQFLLYTAVRVQRKAQNNEGEAVILWKPFRKLFRVDDQIRIGISPIIHDVFPELPLVGVGILQRTEKFLDFFVCCVAVPAIVQDHVLYELCFLGLFPAVLRPGGYT